MIPDASPFWQNAFLVGVFVLFGWCVWSGWRLGIVRVIWSFLGMTAAGVAAIVVGLFLGGLVMAVAPTLAAMVGIAAGALVALMVYVAVSFLGGLLFKRTAQQPTSTLRFAYGAGGAALGVLMGVFTLWGVLLFVRGLGGFCEATVEGDHGLYALPMPEAAAQALVKLKKSVEAGTTGRILETVDVMPADFYRLMDRLGQLVANPEAMRRFLAYPEVKEVIADSQFLSLVNDPDVREMARSQDAGRLAAHPKLIEAVKDPGLLAKLQKIDINQALDYALNSPTPAPVPGAAATP